MKNLDMKCIKCGKCCHEFHVRDASSYLSSINIQEIPFDMEIRMAEIVFHGPCKHVKVENGKSVCTIYDKRPQICREYKCWENIGWKHMVVGVLQWISQQVGNMTGNELKNLIFLQRHFTNDVKKNIKEQMKKKN